MLDNDHNLSSCNKIKMITMIKMTKMRLISMVVRNGQRVAESGHHSFNDGGNYRIQDQGGRTMVWLFICLCWNDDHHNYDRDYNVDYYDVLRDNGF